MMLFAGRVCSAPPKLERVTVPAWESISVMKVGKFEEVTVKESLLIKFEGRVNSI